MDGQTCEQCNLNRVFISETKQCPCQEFYYDGGVLKDCKICNYRCQTCEEDFLCLTCFGTKRLVQKKEGEVENCFCEEGYSDEGYRK